MDITKSSQKNLSPQTIGQIANQVAEAATFERYKLTVSPKTLERQRYDLQLFSNYLADKGIEADLYHSPTAWQHVTFGLVEAFKQWMLNQGYAINTVKARLATIKNYAKLSFQANTLSETEQLKIQTVGLNRRAAKNVDRHRASAGLSTRRSEVEKRDGSVVAWQKKANSVELTTEQANRLKHQHPDTPVGRRNRLMMCLFLDLGFRCGEVAGMTVKNFEMAAGVLQAVYRPKVDIHQNFEMSPDILRAAKLYIGQDVSVGSVFRGAKRNGQLRDHGLTARRMTAIVAALGRAIGVSQLSAHDCRHYWTTTWRRKGVPLAIIKQTGGWSGYTMLSRYDNQDQIANEGVWAYLNQAE